MEFGFVVSHQVQMVYHLAERWYILISGQEKPIEIEERFAKEILEAKKIRRSNDGTIG